MSSMQKFHQEPLRRFQERSPLGFSTESGHPSAQSGPSQDGGQNPEQPTADTTFQKRSDS